MSFYRETEQHIHLNVKINPNSTSNTITSIMDNDIIKINIQAPPEAGKANKTLVQFLARQLHIKKEHIHIKSGTKTKQKKISIHTSKKTPIINYFSEFLP